MTRDNFGTNWFNHLSAKQIYHLRQIAEQERFQLYSPTYWQADGTQQTAEIDLSINQSIPVGLFAATRDNLCPLENTDKLAVDLGAMNRFYKQYVNVTENNIAWLNTPEFVQDLEGFLDLDSLDATELEEEEEVEQSFFDYILCQFI